MLLSLSSNCLFYSLAPGSIGGCLSLWKGPIGYTRCVSRGYRQLSDGMGEHEPSVDFLAFDLPCSSCTYFCTRDCERYHLFHAGWQEGITQAQQLFEHMDLDRVEEIGRTAGFTSKRPPRNYW